jgi:hypothetical protein
MNLDTFSDVFGFDWEQGVAQHEGVGIGEMIRHEDDTFCFRILSTNECVSSYARMHTCVSKMVLYAYRDILDRVALSSSTTEDSA